MSEVLATASCMRCRGMKKKCDRKLPICSLCEKRGACCEYKPPAKRGPKNRQNLDPYPQTKQRESPDNIEEEQEPLRPIPIVQLPNAPKQQHIDSEHLIENDIMKRFATNKLKGVFAAVMLEEDVQRVITYIINANNGIYLVDPPHVDEVALVYSMIAMSLKRRGIKESAIFYNRAREMVLPHVERVLTSYVMASCFAYMAIYLTSSGEKENSFFFLSNVNAYLQLNANEARSELQEVQYRSLEQLYLFAYTMFRPPGNDIFHTIKTFINIHHIMNRYTRIKLQQYGIVAPPSVDEFDNEKITIIRNDLLNSTNNFLIDLQSGERLAAKFIKVFDQLRARNFMDEDEVQDQRITFLCAYQAWRILWYQKSGAPIDADAKIAADLIAELSSMERYNQCTPVVGSATALAAWVHLSILQNPKIDQVERENGLYRLRQEYIALSKLSNTWNIVTERYGKILSHVEDHLRAHEERKIMNHLYLMLNDGVNNQEISETQENLIENQQQQQEICETSTEENESPISFVTEPMSDGSPRFEDDELDGFLALAQEQDVFTL